MRRMAFIAFDRFPWCSTSAVVGYFPGGCGILEVEYERRKEVVSYVN